MKYLLFLSLSLTTLLAHAQKETTFKPNGPDDFREHFHVFIHATIQLSYDKKIEDGVLVIKEGKVIETFPFSLYENKIKSLKGSIIHDLKGQYIYPSFIDLFSDYGLPSANNAGKGADKYSSDWKGALGWNPAIKASFDASAEFQVATEKAKELRKYGFGVVLSHQKDGIARGTASLVTLGDDKENFVLLKPQAAAFYSFDKGSSKQEYPRSLMGTIALLRQTYLDAAWYAKSKQKREFNLSLEAWNKNQSLPSFIDADGDWQKILRADKVGDEFGVQYIIKGNGTEYQRIEELKQTKAPLIIPLNFPKPFDVEDPYRAQWVGVEEMRHWELAPTNASRLAKVGIDFCFTAADSKDDFLKNLRLSVGHGLSEEMALKALTYNPAKWIQADKEVGSIEPGKWANFFISSKSIFDKTSIIYEHWVQGKKYKVNEAEKKVVNGIYNLTWNENQRFTLTLSGEKTKPEAAIMTVDSQKVKPKISFDEKIISLVFSTGKDSNIISYNLSGELISDSTWGGKGQKSDGKWSSWNARLILSTDTFVKAKLDTIDTAYIAQVCYPFLPYGKTTLAKTATYLFKNVTLWTNEEQDILSSSDLIIENGKIKTIGQNLSCANCILIDATGKHITSGIIDEHSHIAISEGVNEGTEASSAEVRIGDVVNSEDINIFRQLAGGVTASQLLHGSANPIGGQSAMIKLRWGQTSEKMKIADADGFIKFALGENVKQSNWGDANRSRYPQTRMGVEQTYLNFFTKAKEYALNLKSKPTETRRDLELDALVEILNKKRFITCHSYVQSEINMLMHVADSFNFKVNTFTHILEGYKVADKMKAHGANASTFADWWAYKYEVIDAIPQNASIMTRMGINTAINSDDAEMARRLNHEAAKSVKYGGISEQDAWKLITLNPAKMLHLEDRMGSLKVGKDADIVVWSANPLSVYAMVEKTFVDGVLLYDRAEAEEMRLAIERERAALIQKMLAEKNGGAKTQSPKPKKQGSYSCGEDHDLEH